ncbi:Armadillo repeat-containing protein 2 [Thoreauomyces humboldtii]|nr:Armadillo repeat-containing protein 2 [Thoreauomyces humboldtii]
MDAAADVRVAIFGCSIVLKLTRNENVLRYAAKLLFKLSQNERNDPGFSTFNVVDSLAHFIASFTSSVGGKPAGQFFSGRCPLLLYAVSTLKNLTHAERAAEALAGARGISILVRVVNVVLQLGIASLPDEMYLQAEQLLVQITETLRNLVTSSGACKSFLEQREAECSPLETLLRTLEAEQGLRDSVIVMTNVCRILSKLSLDPNCLARMRCPVTVTSLTDLLVGHQAEKRPAHQPLLVRASFILGNMTSSPSETHSFLLPAIPNIVALLGMYTGVELGEDSGDEEEDPGGQEGKVGKENEEVLVKMIRLLANLAINEEAGRKIVGMIEIEDLVHLLACKPVEAHQELVLNIVGALANFTFYDIPTNCLLSTRLDIAKQMFGFLLHPNPETVAEAARVLANLSRHADVRYLMAERRGTEILTVLLDHTARDVVFQAAGCIMNATTGGEDAASHAQIVVLNGGIGKLATALLEALQDNDYDLATVAARALYNLCSPRHSKSLPFLDHEERERVQDLIADVLETNADEVQDPRRAALDEVLERLEELITPSDEAVCTRESRAV